MSNPFLNASMEENTLDANDNNPLLKAEDPAKAAEEDGAKIANEFEYVESEAVDGENQKPDEAVLVEAVKDTTVAVKNIVEETKTNADTLDAVASVAQEMYAMIQERGKLLPVEMLTIQNHMASLEARDAWVGQSDVKMPSLESFKVVGLQYTTSQVAMEGVFASLNAGIKKLFARVELLIKNGSGLAASGLKLVETRKAAASDLMRSLDGSHREAGLKEVSGSFVSRLLVDGRVPDPSTVLKTAVYMNQCMGELLSDNATKYAADHIREAMKGLMEGIRTDRMDRPSGWLTFWIFFFFGGGYLPVIPAIKVAHDMLKTRSQIKVDPRMSPQLFRLYPNIAKVNSDADARILEAKRSLPLFGNVAIQVEQYADVVRREEINKTNVPNIKLVKVGRPTGGNTMTALTAAQRKDVLNSAVNLLDSAGEYYREYAARNKEFYKTYVDNLDTGLKFIDENSRQGTPYANAIVGSAAGWYTRVFWAGIFSEQAEIAKYAANTAGALIDLVRASSAVAKANVEGSASQESLSVDTTPSNPFM